MECMFHVNEIYFHPVVTFVEGMKKGSGTMQSVPVLNYVLKLDNSNTKTLLPRDQLDILVTRIAEVHFKARLDLFSQQKQNGIEDHSFRSNQLCMLVLACYALTDIPENLQNLLFCKQETICHSRWIHHSKWLSLKTYL